MATRVLPNPQQPAPAPGVVNQLCDYCHLKPKFSNHAYCSKTCGTQAATMCNYCHKKPKFQNFEFCGKNCASLANPGGVRPATQPSAANAARGPAPNLPKGKAAGPTGATQAAPFQLDPVQIAKLVVSQMPQLQGLLNTGSTQQGPALNPSSNNPFLNPASAQPQTHPAPANGIPSTHFSSSGNGVNSGGYPSGTGGLGLGGFGNVPAYQQPAAGSGIVDAEDLECLIPGCGKPVHVDAKGLKTSDYCSQRHRDEAVATGLVSPCIMCMIKPQSRKDYFCSRTCREESLNKQYNVVPGIVEVDDGEDDEQTNQ